MPKLVFNDSPEHMFEAELCHDVMSVGRGGDNDITIVDQSVSRRHALLERRGGTYFVVDRSSKNGVYVNGAKVTAAPLHGEERVEFGNIGAQYSALDDTTKVPRDGLPRVQRLFREDFDVEKWLGAGSQAEVYLAKRRSDGRSLALKVLRSTVTPGSDSESRFIREANTLARLRHPAILPLVDAGRKEEIPYLAVDYMPGGSIEDLLRKTAGSLDLEQTLRLAHRMCLALEHAHEAGVIHRDIKPANIMLDADGQAVLSDFGIAKVLEDSALTASGVNIGTPRYMSPEQFAGRAVTRRTDLYGLGATIYRCLAGKLPIEANSIHELALRVCDDRTVPAPLRGLNARVPQPLAALVHRCLAKDPKRRPASASEVRRQVEVFLRR